MGRDDRLNRRIKDLLEKIEAGEKDLREGRVVSHDEAMERLARRWQGAIPSM